MSTSMPQLINRPAAGAWIHTVLVWMSAAILPLYLTGSRLRGAVILRPADLLSLATIVLTLVFIRGASRHFTRPPVLCLWALVCYILLQGEYMHLRGTSIKEALQLSFIIMVVVATGVQIERDPARFIRAFSILLGLTLIYTLAFHFSKGEYYRYKSSNEGRYVFGIFSVLMLLTASQRKWKGWWLFLFVLSLPPLIASLERKGPAGVLVVLACLLLVHLREKYRLDPRIALVFLGLILLAGIVAFAQPFYDHVRDMLLENYYVDEAAALWESNVHRKALLINGFDLFEKNWFFGTGADTLRDRMSFYFIDPQLGNSTHNFYLDNLIKYGVVGGSLFFTGIFWGTYNAVRRAQDRLLPALWCLYFLFVVAFISDGAAVTYMAIFPIVCGRLFESTPVAIVAQRAGSRAASFVSPRAARRIGA